MQQNKENKPNMPKVEIKTKAATERSKPMNNIEKGKFVDHIRAMSSEELEIVAKEIPIEYCLKRIIEEIEEAAVLKSGLSALVKTTV